ncbi:hypothetical protein ACIQCF_35190 [Streptomyces sp. NPDC088353]
MVEDTVLAGPGGELLATRVADRLRAGRRLSGRGLPRAAAAMAPTGR